MKNYSLFNKDFSTDAFSFRDIMRESILSSTLTTVDNADLKKQIDNLAGLRLQDSLRTDLLEMSIQDVTATIEEQIDNTPTETIIRGDANDYAPYKKTISTSVYDGVTHHEIYKAGLVDKESFSVPCMYTDGNGYGEIYWHNLDQVSIYCEKEALDSKVTLYGFDGAGDYNIPFRSSITSDYLLWQNFGYNLPPADVLYNSVGNSGTSQLFSRADHVHTIPSSAFPDITGMVTSVVYGALGSFYGVYGGMWYNHQHVYTDIIDFNTHVYDVVALYPSTYSGVYWTSGVSHTEDFTTTGDVSVGSIAQVGMGSNYWNISDFSTSGPRHHIHCEDLYINDVSGKDIANWTDNGIITGDLVEMDIASVPSTYKVLVRIP